MKIEIHETSKEMGRAAAKTAAEVLTATIMKQGSATFVAATGASQFDFLEALTTDPSIDWSRTTMFHLDEYIGLAEQHPASFRRYLRERLVDKVHPGTVHFINGSAPDPEAETSRLGNLIAQHVVDVAFIGVGENGHVAFNDPPADFETERPFLVVDLEEKCRLQQVGEGWFATLDEVPRQAITMSVKQIMKSGMILCIVPDARKARAIQQCFQNEEISPLHPASILKKHPNTILYLDRESAALLSS